MSASKSKALELPAAWWEADPGHIDPDSLSIRFHRECHEIIADTARRYGISRAKVVRMLVRAKLRDLGAVQ